MEKRLEGGQMLEEGVSLGLFCLNSVETRVEARDRSGERRGHFGLREFPLRAVTAYGFYPNVHFS